MRRLTPILIVLCAVGLILRIVAARGDLWLDEIWSFILVSRVASLTDVVIALPYDNNHVLNSLWLKLIGPAASSELARASAVLFGVLAVPVAARLGARVSPTAAVATAVIVALDYTFVHFGSEARGYAGLILGFLVALDAIETRLENESAPSSLIVLAVGVAVGTLSHLTMLEASGTLCMMAAARLMMIEGVRGAWPGRLAPIVLAVVLGSLPASACFAVSVMTAGPLHIGQLMPFSLATFADGLEQVARATLGVWDVPLSLLAVAAALPLLGLGIVAMMPLVPRERRVLPVLGLLGLPLLHIALHLPNQIFARFHLTTGICLALFVAEVWARAWTGSRLAHGLALAAVLAFAAGQVLELSRFSAEGRGSFAAATTLVTRQGPARIAVLPSAAGPETAAVMRWYVERAHASVGVTLASDTSLCATTADWLVSMHRPDGASDTAEATRLAATPCADRFVPVGQFRAYGLSGITWFVLRRGSS